MKYENEFLATAILCFLKKIAIAMFNFQNGNAFIYIFVKDQKSWFFFSKCLPS